MKEIDQLLNKKMSRKEFLNSLLFGFMSMVGVVAIIDFLSGSNSNQNSNTDNLGFGNGNYGGSTKDLKNNPPE